MRYYLQCIEADLRTPDDHDIHAIDAVDVIDEWVHLNLGEQQ
jgi:hypothetical protein